MRLGPDGSSQALARLSVYSRHLYMLLGEECASMPEVIRRRRGQQDATP